MGKSSIYHYIHSKEQLLYQIHDTFINHLNERINALSESDLAPEAKLEAIIIDAIEVVARYKPLVAIFFSEMRSLSRARMKRIAAKRDQYEQVLTRVITQGIASGTFVSDNAKITSLSILGMLNWAHQWLDPNGPLPPREIGRQMARLALGGLGAPEATRAR
jgi:AcrR family transcriptional regulator